MTSASAWPSPCPDDSRETETLARWPGLLSASLPSYWPEKLLGEAVTFYHGTLNARRCYLRVAWDDASGSEFYDPIEIVDLAGGRLPEPPPHHLGGPGGRCPRRCREEIG